MTTLVIGEGVVFENSSSSATTPAAGATLSVKTSRLKLKLASGTELDLAATGDAATSAVTVSATDKVIGRSSSGGGAAEEIAFTAFARSLADDSDYEEAQSTLTPSCAWADMPAANTVTAGVERFVTDVGGGTKWMSTGTAWVPAGGRAKIGRQYADVVGTTSISEQILQQFTIPAALLSVGLAVVIGFRIEKSGTTDSGTINLRIGSLGTTADASVAQYTHSAANRTYSNKIDLSVSSATQVTPETNRNVAAYGNAATTQPETTTDNISSALIVSVSVTMSGTTDTPTLKASSARVER